MKKLIGLDPFCYDDDKDSYWMLSRIYEGFSKPAEPFRSCFR